MADGERVRLDYSASSVLVVCTCGWREVTLGRPAARLVGAAHLQRTHHDAKRADSLLKYVPR